MNEFSEFTHSNSIEKFFGPAKIGGMKNKPLIFTVLSVLCLIEPLIKILYFKAITHFDFLVIFANLKARNTFVEVFDFWLAFPIAGILILRLRKWTYVGFMTMLGYIVYNIFTYEKYTWPYNSDTPFMYNYVVALGAVAVFLYFLSPKAREPFFDRRARLWETKTRYKVDIYCKLQSSSLTFPSKILNISKTGVFVQESPYINIGDLLVMEFNFLGETVEVPLRIVHKYTSVNKSGFGAEFVFKSFSQSLKMAKVISVIQKSHGLFKDGEKEPTIAA